MIVVEGTVSNVRECTIDYPRMERPGQITLFDMTVNRTIAVRDDHTAVMPGETIRLGVGYNSYHYIASFPVIKEGSEYLAFLFDTSYYKEEPFKRLGNVADYWLGYSDSLCFEKVGDSYLGTEYLTSYKGARVMLDTIGISYTDFEQLKGPYQTFTQAARALMQSGSSSDASTGEYIIRRVRETSSKYGITEPFVMLDVAVERMEEGRNMYVIGCASLESGIKILAEKYWRAK